VESGLHTRFTHLFHPILPPRLSRQKSSFIDARAEPGWRSGLRSTLRKKQGDRRTYCNDRETDGRDPLVHRGR
jgi:hypothetical protein